MSLGVETLWETTRGDPRICIAVLDGPVDLSHPCFEAASLESIGGFTLTRSADSPAACHGTHTASVIFGQHCSSVPGVAPGCRGLIVPIFGDADEGGIRPCSQIDLARAITAAVVAGAHVVNIGGGEMSPSDKPHELLANALRQCAERNVLVVAAAGNDGCDCLHIPAAVPTVLSVGAMDEEGNPLGFSNWGWAYRRQGILAPGKNILGAVPGGGTVRRSGTSFATPIVTGIVGLLLSRQLARGQPANPNGVRSALLTSALGCDLQPAPDCRRLLVGRLNLSGAISNLDRRGDLDMSEENTVDQHEAEKGVRAEREDPPSSQVQMAEAQAAVPERKASIARPPASEPFVTGVQREVGPSACSDGSCGKSQFVYALGTLGYDFRTAANEDWFSSRVHDPHDPAQMLGFLGDQLTYLKEDQESDESRRFYFYASNLTWTINHGNTAIYAIQPFGPFAERTYGWLRVFLRGQVTEGVEVNSFPGVLAGTTILMNGQSVPLLVPDLRGMFSWSVEKLVTSIVGEKPAPKAAKAVKDEHSKKTQELGNFLNRVYHELRNLGTAPEDRALNFAATNAFDLQFVFHDAFLANRELDRIEVEKSATCRPGSDCWEVKLSFFDPENLQRASRIYQYSVDVSDVIPVRIDEVRSYSART